MSRCRRAEHAPSRGAAAGCRPPQGMSAGRRRRLPARPIRQARVTRDLARLRPILVDAPRGAIEAAEIEITADGHHVEKAAQPIHRLLHIELTL